MDLERRWRRACALVTDNRDIIDVRPGPEVPEWAARRGWAAFLGGLTEAELEACETDGLGTHAEALGAPPGLIRLANEARIVCALDVFDDEAGAPPRFKVGARKRIQVAAFAAAVGRRVGTVHRVVDVGAGHGHLTRHLAEAFRVDGLGLEWDPDRVGTARALAGADVRFEVADLFAGPPPLAPTDLAVGLHACGGLSDLLVTWAADAGASIAFASCCLQKRREAARIPLMPLGPVEALTLPRAVLGLGNITTCTAGIEASMRANIAARSRRAGLRALLEARGIALGAGDEMHGINRRRAHGSFADLVALALERRALAPATPDERALAEAEGHAHNARVRRWSIARRLLGRVLEVQINLDRARYLADRGYRVEVGLMWPAGISPRNVGVIATRG